SEHTSSDLASGDDEDIATLMAVRQLESRLTTAIQDASIAKTSAQNAASTATAANTAAGNAVNTANAANTAANNAVSTANTAKDTANNAKNAVQGATNAANAATETANTAAAKVDSFEEAISDGYGNTLMAMDLAGGAVRDIDAQKFTRNQVIDAMIENKGVIEGLELSKSTTATRNLTATDGRVFVEGREYPVIHQENTAHIANNTTSSQGTVVIYLRKMDGIMEIESTPLNEDIPADCIEIARVTIPAGNTENNDPYLTNVTIRDTARREPGWPNVQMMAGQIFVPLNRTLPDAEYMVDVEVSSATSLHQLGQVAATNKKKNGFLLVTTGTADKIKCRCHVKHPSHPFL
ncbi:MAG: hypothetical protein IK079_06405, partial [Desulfovibrio sp.]|nr:hypothetical protein [Desulfovibrio sp.]